MRILQIAAEIGGGLLVFVIIAAFAFVIMVLTSSENPFQ
jgi:hypothetical protein